MYRDRDDLYKVLNCTENAVEVGVASGNFSRIINTWGFKRLFLVDSWTEFKDWNGKITTQQTVNAWYDKVYNDFKDAKIIKAKSLDASKCFSEEYFDFIYIDADHSYNSVLSDLKAWFPKCKKGGIFSGHDYGVLGTGVKQAVDEFCKDYRINVTKGTRRIPASWWIRK
jgi:hypothetical protein